MGRVMGKLLKGFAIVLAGLVGLVAIGVTSVYAASEIIIRKAEPKAAVSIAAAHDAGAVARGQRIAKVYGCHDCHGADLTGRLFFDEMPIARIAGPNLTLELARQGDADIARAIRTGVAADGRALWIMPSQAFSRLSDAETSDLLAYLRTFPARGARQPAKQIGPVGRLGLVLGKFKSEPQRIRDDARLTPPPALPDLGPAHARGRQLVRACVECHGMDLKGTEMAGAPDLSIAAAYEPADFERLLRTGVGMGGKKLGLMSESAPGRFNTWSHEEIAALQDYLRARVAAR